MRVMTMERTVARAPIQTPGHPTQPFARHAAGHEDGRMGAAAGFSPAEHGERRFSGALSDDYDLWRLARPFLGEVHEAVFRAVSSFAQARDRPLRALDIGMGDGGITTVLLGDAKLVVTGVDSEPKMIERARERLAEELAGGRLEVLLDDALHYLAGQATDAFELIASGYVLHNLRAEYRGRLYEVIWRVLAPSGLFVNADKYAQAGEAHHEAMRFQLNSFFDVLVPREKYELLREWVLHYFEDEAPDRLMLEADAIERMNELGFVEVRVVFRRSWAAVVVAKNPTLVRADGPPWGRPFR